VPDFNAALAPQAKGGTSPFIMRTDLVGALFGPLIDGPFPEHYEPIESPTQNLLSKRQNNPVAKIWKVPDGKNELAPTASPDYPYVITTYRLTEHHLSGVMSRYLPMLAELHYAHFAEISHELAKELGIANGDMVTVSSPRGKIHVKAMVTHRLKPFLVNGKPVHQIGVPWHWGYKGVEGLPGSKGDITNDLSATVGDPTVFIQETKAFVCNVKKGVV
jgi:formate dehydrogenase major subunit